MTTEQQAILDELNKRLEAGPRKDESVTKVLGENHGHLKHVPHIKCADGFKMSVQASEYHYCSPRDSFGPWSTVEVGYPSERVEALMDYIDGDENTEPTSTVYGYVPLIIVAKTIAEHGGFADA